MQSVARWNPLTYEVDGLRPLLLAGPTRIEATDLGLLTHIAALMGIYIALLLLAASQVPKIVQSGAC